MTENELKACVAGSFNKFKPEIDSAINELADRGVLVLAPDKGWLLIPIQKILTPSDYRFRPLKEEAYMSIKEIEDQFLKDIKRSDFLYVINPEGYIGTSVSMEIGFALANNIPVYLQREISPLIIENDQVWSEIEPKIKVMSIKEAVIDVEKLKITNKTS